MRAVVISHQDVDVIPDGSVLYACAVDAREAGIFVLSGGGAIAADDRGRRLSTTINEGIVTVSEAPTPTSTALPTATASLPPDTTPSATPDSGDVAQAANDSSSGMGCAMNAQAAGGGWIPVLTVLLLLAGRELHGRRRSAVPIHSSGSVSKPTPAMP